MNQPVDTAQTRMVYETRTKLFLLLAAFVAGLIGAIAILNGAFTSRRYGDILPFIGWTFLVIMPIAMVVMVRRIVLAGRPALIISPTGLYVRALADITLPWRSIAGVGGAPLAEHHSLQLSIDPATNAALPFSALVRRAKYGLMLKGNGDIILPGFAFDTPVATVKAWVRVYAETHGRGRTSAASGITGVPT